MERGREKEEEEAEDEESEGEVVILKVEDTDAPEVTLNGGNTVDLKVDDTYIKKNAKLHRLLELVDEIVARGEKVVIFSNWVEPLRTVYRYLVVKYKVCCFTGTMKEKDRQQHKETFLLAR